ncbi:molecular chaperone HtpG [Mollicutes bacterium LVI A0078]|nr:molecular chaperone HtpG [Mollicutes bacterium LVI A0075]WOO91239.1 molecular chaperone HtpG [Mollicutes bacterium LVI A0078]
MVNKQFKAESKQLLELMIHSIYSSKDIFLRELISNSSDALDKRHFISLTDNANEYKELKIKLVVNEENRTIQIIDNGIGMDNDDLENNLGTIASSGTKQFMEKMSKDNADIETIGQFGVGFYSAFIVSDKVTVETKKANSDSFIWESDGVDSYSITEGTRTEIGSTLTLHIRSGEEFDQFLDQNVIISLVKKYSNYIKYPIVIDMVTTKNGEDDEASIEVVEETVINSQKALWKRSKSEIEDEEYNEFYKSNYYDYLDPRFTFHVQVEGTQNFEFLGFVPSQNNNIFETIESSKGLDLYCKGVLIDKEVDYLINPAFNFIKGLVDSSDLNLNISREMLQRDDVVSKLTKALNNRIKKELERKMKKDRDEYNKFYEIYGNALTFGIYNNYGADKDLFKDLVQFESNKTGEMTSLKEYLANNEGAEKIYYATGESSEVINSNPIIKKATTQGYEILFLTNDIDEFAIKIMDSYNDILFASYEEIDLATDEEKEQANELTKDNEQMLINMASSITNLKSVEINPNLEDEPCRIKAGGQISLEMEKVLAKNPDGGLGANEKILELNPNHQLFNKLKAATESELSEITHVIYNQQLLKEGLALEDSEQFINTITNLLIKK